MPSLAALPLLAATLSAQCVATTGTQSLLTTLGGNWIYGNGTAPLFGVSQDPGPACRCDLTATLPINISAITTSLYADGQTIAGVITTSNLVGVPGCQIEMWVLPGGSVLNAANSEAYTS